MIAILGWTDGFGNDTYVWGIYPTLEIAKRYAKKELRWVEFDFGEVELLLFRKFLLHKALFFNHAQR